MKLFLFLMLVCCLQTTDATAQKKIKYKIKPGEKVIEKIPKEEVYTYAEFTNGTVYLRNNTIFIAPMNYNSLYAEMQFIDKEKDTLSVADEKLIKLIVINKDTFYYDNGYMKLVLDQGKVKLVNHQFFEITNKEKIGEFGNVGHGSIETYNNISTKSYLKDIVANEIITMAKSSVFYIGDEFNRFKVVNKKSLLDMYANNQDEVKAYLKENKIDFSNEKELKKMLVYFNKLVPVKPL
jgi:hypothetical protein